jgi:hypothetical protein
MDVQDSANVGDGVLVGQLRDTEFLPERPQHIGEWARLEPLQLRVVSRSARTRFRPRSQGAGREPGAHVRRDRPGDVEAKPSKEQVFDAQHARIRPRAEGAREGRNASPQPPFADCRLLACFDCPTRSIPTCVDSGWQALSFVRANTESVVYNGFDLSLLISILGLVRAS